MKSAIVRQLTHEAQFFCLKVSVPAQWPKAAHTHGVHEFFACSDERGTQFAGCAAIPQDRGDLFCFPAGMPHYCSGKPYAGGYVFMVPDALFAPDAYGDSEAAMALRRAVRFATDGRNPLPVVRNTGLHVLSLACDMAREFSERKHGHQVATKHLVLKIFLDLLRDPGFGGYRDTDSRPSSPDERMARVLRFVEAHFMERITVSAMGEMAGMGRSRFHEEFRRVTGCTLIEYLTRVRIRAAQRLLRDTDARVLEVALDCGFPSLSRFYDAFKAQTGTTPGRMRT